MKILNCQNIAAMGVIGFTAANFNCAIASASLLTPVNIIKCEEADGKSDKSDKPFSFKMIVYVNEYEDGNPGKNIRTIFKGTMDGLKIKAEGLTSRTGFTPNHKAIFETTFPKETGDMSVIKIRYASGSVPWSAIEQAALIAPPLGGMPASIPLNCKQSYSFR